jgi:hypothetical protein
MDGSWSSGVPIAGGWCASSRNSERRRGDECSRRGRRPTRLVGQRAARPLRVLWSIEQLASARHFLRRGVPALVSSAESSQSTVAGLEPFQATARTLSSASRSYHARPNGGRLLNRLNLRKSRVREIRTLGSVRAKAEWLRYSTASFIGQECAGFSARAQARPHSSHLNSGWVASPICQGLGFDQPHAVRCTDSSELFEVTPYACSERVDKVLARRRKRQEVRNRLGVVGLPGDVAAGGARRCGHGR